MEKKSINIYLYYRNMREKEREKVTGRGRINICIINQNSKGMSNFVLSDNDGS